MYRSKHFDECRIPVLHDAIAEIVLGTLITFSKVGLQATHLPFFIDREAGDYGVLYGHMARANPHWLELALSNEVLVTFLGPEAYITPSWYETKEPTGRVVPTWNYVSVQARGAVEIFEDTTMLRNIVERLTTQQEAGRDKPWHVDDAPPEYISAQLGGIIGLKIPVTELYGKWKMSQNRPLEDRVSVVNALHSSSCESNRAVAGVMADVMKNSSR
jgi:transcriptional regulator